MFLDMVRTDYRALSIRLFTILLQHFTYVLIDLREKYKNYSSHLKRLVSKPAPHSLKSFTSSALHTILNENDSNIVLELTPTC